MISMRILSIFHLLTADVPVAAEIEMIRRAPLPLIDRDWEGDLARAFAVGTVERDPIGFNAECSDVRLSGTGSRDIRPALVAWRGRCEPKRPGADHGIGIAR